MGEEPEEDFPLVGEEVVFADVDEELADDPDDDAERVELEMEEDEEDRESVR
ncbi:MAG: hypothetical protein Q4P36_02955 [Bowdeniella nasicola]|nr:hypothetical protein [Bowdeniella nasicola]